MKTIFICSPLRGNIRKNIAKAKAYGREAYKLGYFPIVAHAYTDIIAPELKDSVPKQRRKILDIGLILLSFCDELWVYGDMVSKGMQGEIKYAKLHGIKIKWK